MIKVTLGFVFITLILFLIALFIRRYARWKYRGLVFIVLSCAYFCAIFALLNRYREVFL
jgi:uncharacterized membrane protein YccC